MGGHNGKYGQGGKSHYWLFADILGNPVEKFNFDGKKYLDVAAGGGGGSWGNGGYMATRQVHLLHQYQPQLVAERVLSTPLLPMEQSSLTTAVHPLRRLASHSVSHRSPST